MLTFKRRYPPLIGYPPEFNDEFKHRIRKRDGYICSICAIKARLDVHHIDYTKYTVPGNCISLCRNCHYMLHKSSWVDRTTWRMRLAILAAKREKINAA